MINLDSCFVIYKQYLLNLYAEVQVLVNAVYCSRLFLPWQMLIVLIIRYKSKAVPGLKKQKLQTKQFFYSLKMQFSRILTTFFVYTLTLLYSLYVENAKVNKEQKVIFK